MANVAEKVGDMAKDKPGPEKRRALGRGLESLLPGPRVVNTATAARNAVAAPNEEIGQKPASTFSQSARKDGAPSGVISGAPGVSPMAGVERAVVRNEGIRAESHGSQVSGTERREPGAPSLPGTPSLPGAPSRHGARSGSGARGENCSRSFAECAKGRGSLGGYFRGSRCESDGRARSSCGAE